MGKTATGRGGRPLDVEATKQARSRHAQGIRTLRQMCLIDPEVVQQLIATQRRTGGTGPTGAHRHTRAHWTRAGRRATAKAQRIARRANRA